MKVQNIFFYIAPPFAVIFTLGILWRRATGCAALATIFLTALRLLERRLTPWKGQE